MIITDEQTGELITTTIEQMRDVQIKVKMMQECMDLSESVIKDMILTIILAVMNLSINLEAGQVIIFLQDQWQKVFLS